MYRRRSYGRSRPYARYRRYPLRAYRKPTRRYPVRRRRYARRRTTPRGILNLTSRKKQDNLISWKKDSPYVGGEVGNWNLTVPEAFGGRYWIFGFIPTARGITTSTGAGESNVNDDATRTSTRCYMRGFKDNIRLESSSGRNYLWRRICFTFTGQEILDTSTPSGTLNGALWTESSGGYVRAMTLLQPNVSSGVWINLATILFKGVGNVDWNDLMSAKVDNTRVTVCYDKTIPLRSQNDSGNQWSFKRWHKMNKTLVYNDDEAGGSKNPAELSVNTRKSMGDYYVIDIFDVGLQPDDGGELNVGMNGTMYWHER